LYDYKTHDDRNLMVQRNKRVEMAWSNSNISCTHVYVSNVI